MSKKHVTCYYCKGNHSCRDCPTETKIAPFMKKIVGMHMEYFVANELKCPRCNCVSLRLLGNHTPSLDIICDNCIANFEVKSKCLSVNNIPKDLTLSHGNYFNYLSRQHQGLDFIIIIYGVDRATKIINIRKVLYASDSFIKNNVYFKVLKKPTATMSDIRISDYTKLSEIVLDQSYAYDFSQTIAEITTNEVGMPVYR